MNLKKEVKSRSLYLLRFPLLVSLGLASLMPKGFSSTELVNDETIKFQKDSTFELKLDNQVPVTYRQIPGSEIFLIMVAFDFGESFLRSSERPQLGVLTELMERGSTSYPKDNLFALLEKYATGINCGMGIEQGSCSLSTLNPYVDELLPAFASQLIEPSFDPLETKLVLEQAQAAEAASLQNPESYVNEVVNGIFYGEKHPYWAPQARKLEALSKIKLDDLKALHQRLLHKTAKRIVVVGSMPPDDLKKLLNKHFALFQTAPQVALKVPRPTYSPSKNFRFAARDIPTSYVRAKFVMPGIDSPDLIASQLMIHILSEELENEVRTKRSLSYSVYAQVIPYSMGIGVLHASTSKPKETLEVIKPIIEKLKGQKLSQAELARYKTVFATSYFLNLEEHSSLAVSMANSMSYFKTTDRLYEMPRMLAAITPDDIQKAAQKYLKQFRLGVVFKEKGFDTKWAQDFLKSFP